MRSHPAFKLINKKFIEAVDVLKAAYEQHPSKKKLFDNGVGVIISPNNKSKVGKIRKGEDNLNHYELLIFAEHFSIPIEYFYYEDLIFTFSFDKNNPDNFISKVKSKKPYSHNSNIEIDKEPSGNDNALNETFDSDKIDLYQSLLKTCQEMNATKDQLILAKDKQIDVLTKYNESLEKRLE
ncbi:hypothetical protein [uncultured Aquimarina sp.]|uniref:hypothetical protein n=1 Tax=uncultured Aquimarina sp. TaxID=575652 RepID=UPI002637D97C|nr:hypothetical protein [uncultured Aquimarina sp.]